MYTISDFTLIYQLWVTHIRKLSKFTYIFLPNSMSRSNHNAGFVYFETYILPLICSHNRTSLHQEYLSSWAESKLSYV